MLTAPFPWYGGKRRQAAEVWAALGNPTVFVEPFFGSGAVLLARPDGAGPREIVCDTDGGVANFWRAVQADADEVAFWADYPTVHQDLTARHRWLKRWVAEHSGRLSEDPEFYDVRAAGWWVWGISLWIGGGWCADSDARMPMANNTGGGRGVSAQRTFDQRPHVDHKGGGRGVGAQRLAMPGASDQRPHVAMKPGGMGVAAQRTRLPEVSDKIPKVAMKTGGQGVSAQRTNLPSDQMPKVHDRGGGQGVSAQKISMPSDQIPQVESSGGQGVSAQRTFDKRPHVKTSSGGQGVSAQRTTRPELVGWFRQLQDRLQAVVILNRSWQSALTPTLLQHTRTGPKPPVGIFLDPPYLTAERSTTLYGSDLAGTSDAAAVESYRWAVDNGDRFRIVYACHDGDFPIPDGWATSSNTFSGVKDPDRRDRLDMLMFSPACRPTPNQQPQLFAV